MNKQSILQYVENSFLKSQPADFRIGDTVRVHVKIIEGNNSRVQVYEGIVTAIKGQRAARTFTVRKISFSVGVERVFPLYSPTIEKITVVRSGKVRRAKLYYLRDRLGRAAKLEEKVSSDNKSANNAAPSVAPVAPAVKPAELVSADEK
jgi:large subunit ribosomal protein L19